MGLFRRIAGFPSPSSVPASVQSSFTAIPAKEESRWYTRRLCMDEDGDVSDEFLSEVTTEMLPDENQTARHKLRTEYDIQLKESDHCCRWEYTSELRALINT